MLNLTTEKSQPEIDRRSFRQEAANAIAFANTKAKSYYDSSHKPLRLNVGDKAFLWLHHGYNLPHKPNKKLSNQCAGNFLIKRRIGNMAYELDLPPAWKVHTVISIAQLEPANNSSDPYMRPRPTNPGAVEMSEGNDTYEVEKVIKNRVRCYEKRIVKQYLLQWRGYGPEHDEWRNENECSDCISAVNEFLAKGSTTTNSPPIVKKSKAVSTTTNQNKEKVVKKTPAPTTPFPNSTSPPKTVEKTPTPTMLLAESTIPSKAVKETSATITSLSKATSPLESSLV